MSIHRASASDAEPAAGVFFCAAAVYAAAVFWTRATGLPHWLVDVFAVTVTTIMIGRAAWLHGGVARRPWLTAAAIGVLLVVAGLLVAASASTELRLTPYLPVVLSNVAVTAIFARGLRKGGRPIILQLVDVMAIGPEPSPEFRAFARRQCVAWMIMGSVMAAAGVAGMVSEPLRPAADIAIPVLTLLQLVWFVVSHNIGMSRYGRPESWLDTLKAMTSVQTWSALEV